MTFTLRVPADCSEESYKFNQTIEELESEETHKKREFHVQPRSATVEPQSTQEIQVNNKCLYISNYQIIQIGDNSSRIDYFFEFR